MTRKIFYAGSFDPVTMGHVDLIERASRLFDGVVVGVGSNVTKAPLFTSEERVEMVRDQTVAVNGVEVIAFDGLAVEAARHHGCGLLLRGLRTSTDFENELVMALTNRRLAPDIDTVFMAPSERYGYLSSRLIKEVVLNGGRIDEFIAPGIARALIERTKKRKN